MVHWVALIYISWARSQTPAYTARRWIWGYCMVCCACLLPSFHWYHTHCTYPRRDGQTGLTWVTGNTLGWFTQPQMAPHPSKTSNY